MEGASKKRHESGMTGRLRREKVSLRKEFSTLVEEEGRPGDKSRAELDWALLRHSEVRGLNAQGSRVERGT